MPDLISKNDLFTRLAARHGITWSSFVYNINAGRIPDGEKYPGLRGRWYTTEQARRADEHFRHYRPYGRVNDRLKDEIDRLKDELDEAHAILDEVLMVLRGD
jgi:hypothetical protein